MFARCVVSNRVTWCMHKVEEEAVHWNYIDKAIVEEQAEERSTDAGLLWYGRLHWGFHSGEEFWTRSVVEVGRKLCIGTPQYEEKQKETNS